MNKRIRPSSVSSFAACNKSWYESYANDKNTTLAFTNSAAAVGTAIHAAVEHMWSDTMIKGVKHADFDGMYEAGKVAFIGETNSIKTIFKYDKDMDEESCLDNIARGTRAYINDILPWIGIPSHIETRFSMPVVSKDFVELSGTVDYFDVKQCILADIKTSKRKVQAQSHVIQQSIYKYLVQKNGYTVNQSLIHAIIILKTECYGEILELQPDIPQALYVVDVLLKKLEAVNKYGLDPDVIFSGNNKHYLCTDKYCEHRPNCKFAGKGL